MAKKLLVTDPIGAFGMISLLKKSYEVNLTFCREDTEEEISRGGYDGFFMTDLTVTSRIGRNELAAYENGLEIVKLASEKGLPTVVATGASEEIRKKAENLGAKKVLEFPADVDDVLAAFKEAGF